MTRNASQIARAPGAVRGESFCRIGIKLAGADVPLDRGVEVPAVKGFEPGAKAFKLARGELFDGFLDVFGGGHVLDIAFTPLTEKGNNSTRFGQSVLRAGVQLML